VARPREAVGCRTLICRKADSGQLNDLTVHPVVDKRRGVTADVSRTHAGRLRGVHGPAPPSECQSRNRSLLIETEICDFRRDRESCSLLSPAVENPVAQLDDVHSVLRLNYETLEG